MNVNDLTTAAENLFIAAVGKDIDDKLKKNVSDVASLASLALTLIGRNSELEAEAVIKGLVEVTNGVTDILTAVKGKVADTSTPAVDTSVHGDVITQ